MHRDQFGAYTPGERGVKRVDAAPRGHAKSTIKALFRPIWDLCYRQERYIYIISNTEDQSIQKLESIRKELLENELLIAVYGPFFSSRNVGKASFVASVRGFEVLFQAAGSKKEVRGKRFGAHRPSKLVIDDYEHSTEVESEAIREKSKALYHEVFAKLGNKQTNIEVIGTVLHRDSFLSGLLENPTYTANVYKSIISWATNQDLWEEWKKIYIDLDRPHRVEEANEFYKKNEEKLLEGVEVLWPEHESYLDLQKEIISGGLRAFMKEKQNAPMSDEEKIFNMEEAGYFTDCGNYLLIETSGVKIYKSNLKAWCAIDPATGEVKPRAGKKGDFTCILVGYTDDRNRLFVTYDFTKRVPPSTFIKKIFELRDQYLFTDLGVETNLFRNLLQGNIRQEEKKINDVLRIPHKRLRIHEIYNLEKKDKRIFEIEPKVEYKWILFNRTLTREFFNQMSDFNKGDHDDAPDALHQLWSMTHRRMHVGGVRV